MPIPPLKTTGKLSIKGFTLAELLIALTVLAVIATFTIPKVLQGQQNGQFNAIAKETVSAVVNVSHEQILENGMNANASIADYTPYLNYAKLDTSSQIDSIQGLGTQTCGTGGWECLRLHNGAVLRYNTGQYFGGTANTNALYFYLDPDGKITDGTTDGPGKAILFYIYTDGTVRTGQTLKTNTANSWFSGYSPCGSCDPPWFSWN